MRGSPASLDGGRLPRLDTGTAHSTRVWNYLLGGKDNFAADREMCDRMLEVHPGIAQMAKEQHRFLVRSVRYLAGEAGIRQFLEIGVGLPVGISTHQVAQQITPTSRIVYVDNDPLVLVHARALLRSAPGGMTSYVEADVRDTEEIVGEAARTLDFEEPVAVMMLGVLGQVPAFADASAVVARMVGALPPGSYLVLNDATDASPTLSQAIAVYNQDAARPYHLRSPEQIAGFFQSLALVPPGVVSPSQWRPDLADTGAGQDAVDSVCGVGRKDPDLGL
jgi:hypothetical protein